MADQNQSFVEFMVENGYGAFRKKLDAETKDWVYVPCTNLSFFSCYSPGDMDIRLMKEDGQEVIFGVPCDVPDGNGKTKVHSPTLIWPPICGSSDNVFEIDKLFEEKPYEEILEMIEQYFIQYPK